MGRHKVLLLVLGLVVAFARPAEAQPVRNYDYASPSPCGAINADVPCFAAKAPKVTACKANGSVYCRVCNWNAYQKSVCGTTPNAASCECTNEHIEGTGPNITTCKVSGTCTYAANE
jgi:hypothetical protein